MTDWVMVPREPTDEMVAAGFDVHPCLSGQTKVSDAYRAMLAAAPQQQAEPLSMSMFATKADYEAAVKQQAEPVAYLRVATITGQITGVFLPSEDPELHSERLEPLYTSPRITAEQAEKIKRLADEAMEASKQCAIAMMESSQPFNVAGLRPSLYGQTIGPEGVERKRAALHAALDALIAKEAP